MLNAAEILVSNETEILFDTARISFKMSIKYMEQLKNKSLTFAMILADSNFIIGSHSSNERGKIMKLD